jgi:hypothetical protein
VAVPVTFVQVSRDSGINAKAMLCLSPSCEFISYYIWVSFPSNISNALCLIPCHTSTISATHFRGGKIKRGAVFHRRFPIMELIHFFSIKQQKCGKMLVYMLLFCICQMGKKETTLACLRNGFMYL